MASRGGFGKAPLLMLSPASPRMTGALAIAAARRSSLVGSAASAAMMGSSSGRAWVCRESSLGDRRSGSARIMSKEMVLAPAAASRSTMTIEIVRRLRIEAFLARGKYVAKHLARIGGHGGAGTKCQREPHREDASHASADGKDGGQHARRDGIGCGDNDGDY